MTALATRIGFDPTAQQRQIIRDSFLAGASDEEAAILIEFARARGLNPFLKQIHFMERFDREKNRKVWVPVTGIDGFRSLAEDTGEYDGQDEPVFEYDDKSRLHLARVLVYRRGMSRPAPGIAYYTEFVQTTRDGKPNAVWDKSPHNQLAKCAEAQGFRKGFPQRCGGLYAVEEMPEQERSSPAGAYSVPVAAVTPAVEGDAVSRWIERLNAAQTAPDLRAVAAEIAKDKIDGRGRDTLLGIYRARVTFLQGSQLEESGAEP